jgi:hypothetical protein
VSKSDSLKKKNHNFVCLLRYHHQGRRCKGALISTLMIQMDQIPVKFAFSPQSSTRMTLVNKKLHSQRLNTYKTSDLCFARYEKRNTNSYKIWRYYECSTALDTAVITRGENRSLSLLRMPIIMPNFTCRQVITTNYQGKAHFCYLLLDINTENKKVWFVYLGKAKYAQSFNADCI